MISWLKKRISSDIKVGDCHVDTCTGDVWAHGSKSKLEPRAVLVLKYLLSRPNTVVTKEELRLNVWDGNHVVDEAIRRCISQIRRALKDDPSRPEVIETIPKQGYRLIANVYGTHPVSRRSGFYLGAATIAATILVSVAAIVMLSIFRIEQNSAQPTSALGGAVNLHHVARGLYHEYEPDSMDRAIILYETLLSSNANDAVALTGLADAWLQKYLRWGKDAALAKKALDAARKAIEADIDYAGGFKSIGAYHHFRGEYAEALKYYSEAVRRDPKYWTALNNGGEILRDAGLYDASRTWLTCALHVTPNKVNSLLTLADMERRAGAHEQATRYLRFAAKLDPENQELHDFQRVIMEGPTSEVEEIGPSAAWEDLEFEPQPCLLQSI